MRLRTTAQNLVVVSSMLIAGTPCITQMQNVKAPMATHIHGLVAPLIKEDVLKRNYRCDRRRPRSFRAGLWLCNFDHSGKTREPGPTVKLLSPRLEPKALRLDALDDVGGTERLHLISRIRHAMRHARGGS